MGAVAGSWAGLHGPGEKTIKKTGQSGPGLYKGPGVWDRGPGQRAAGHPSRVGGPGVPGPAGKATRHKQGARGQGSGWGASWGPPSTAARMGCLGTRLPSLGGPKDLVRAPVPRKPPTHHVEASGVFRSWLPLGIHSQKPGPPPTLEDLGSSKPPLSAISGWAVCTGLGHLRLPLSTWALVNLRPGRRPAGVSLQPTVVLSNLGIKHIAHKPQGLSEGFEHPSPRKTWHCPAPLFMPQAGLGRLPHLTARTQGQELSCLHPAPRLALTPQQGLRLIWPFILNG